jgi:hypothetical protein
MKDFMTETYRGPFGNPMSETDLMDSGDTLDETPTYMPYTDDMRGEEPTMSEGDAFTINADDKYIGAQLELPLQDAMARATVVARKRSDKLELG